MAAIAPVAADRGSAAPHCTAHLHVFARLVDGTDIVIRPVHPGDDALERAFIAGLSRDSRYNRLLSGRSLTQVEIRQLTRVDYAREMALVALSRNGGLARLLGDARYVRDADSGGAEFALVVADAWQGKGVGSLLLQALARHGRAAGIVRLHGITLATNQPMQNLARKLGFVQHADPQDATVRRVEKALAPEDLPVAAGAAYPAAANDAAPGGNRMPLPARARTGTATGSLSGAEPG